MINCRILRPSTFITANEYCKELVDLFLDKSISSKIVDPTTISPKLLLPEERVYIKNSIIKRKREFAAGRLLARHLLNNLGFPDRPLMMDDEHVPVWPTGIKGSISHCDDLCMVALFDSFNSKTKNIGIDVEKNKPIERDIWNLISTEEEIERISRNKHLEGQVIQFLFSAKEAVYKCLFPITRKPLEFRDVRILMDNQNKNFSVEIRNKSNLCVLGEFEIVGTYFKNNCHIITTAHLI